jgi:CheY-like chemotaxis protein
VREALADVVAVSRALLDTEAAGARRLDTTPEMAAAAKSLPARVDDVQAAIDEALDGAERIRRIVRDVKAVSTVDDSRKEAVDVRTVLESSLNIVGNEIRHRAQLVKDFQPTPRVDANAGRLGQVFINLLMNAAQAIREGNASQNKIRVTTRTDLAGRVIVEIADTGSGIPDEVRGRIFEPFFTTKPVGVGSGLGLSISHGIISSLGGEITFESDRGKGTTFRVVLRQSRRETPPIGMKSVGSMSPVPRARILVIDDNAGVQRALRRMLEYDHELVFADSGKLAIEILQRDRGFDIILCDLMMPEVTGMDLYEEVSRSAPHLAERMVFLTGGGFTPRAREFIDKLGKPPLVKPVDPAALRAALKQALEKRKKRR